MEYTDMTRPAHLTLILNTILTTRHRLITQIPRVSQNLYLSSDENRFVVYATTPYIYSIDLNAYKFVVNTQMSDDTNKSSMHICIKTKQTNVIYNFIILEDMVIADELTYHITQDEYEQTSLILKGLEVIDKPTLNLIKMIQQNCLDISRRFREANLED